MSRRDVSDIKQCACLMEQFSHVPVTHRVQHLIVLRRTQQTVKVRNNVNNVVSLDVFAQFMDVEVISSSTVCSMLLCSDASRYWSIKITELFATCHNCGPEFHAAFALRPWSQSPYITDSIFFREDKYICKYGCFPTKSYTAIPILHVCGTAAQQATDRHLASASRSGANRACELLFTSP